MTTLTFSEIAELVSHSRTTEITPRHSAAVGDHCALYNGAYQIHGKKIPFSVLYVHSRASAKSISEAISLLPDTEDLHVVYQDAFAKRSPAQIERLARIARRTETPREYLASFMRDELLHYQKEINRFDLDSYIDPQFKDSRGFIRNNPGPVERFLRDAEATPLESSRLLAVVLAEPGQGKTFMCEHLTRRLISDTGSVPGNVGVIPIFVRSDQWEDIRQEDLSSLWKTMTHVFQHEGAHIPWISGCEELFLRTTLKAGLFRVIFDGFDEYVLRNHGEISATDVLDQLDDLVKETGARIVITSRTSFWETEVSQDNEDTGREFGIQLLKYVIEPFDLSHAENYFKKCIVRGRLISQACKVFKALRDKSEYLAGRGFVLKLVADLFHESDGSDFAVSQDTTQVLPWLMSALCERDARRQNLPINATAQLEALRGFVTDVVKGESPRQELLELHIEMAHPTLTKSAIEKCCKGMEAHPLINREPDGTWKFTQEPIMVSLLSDAISILVENNDQAKLNRLDKGKLDGTLLRDVAYLWLDPVVASNSKDDAIRSIRSFVESLSGSIDKDKVSSTMFSQLIGFLLLRAVKDLEPSANRKERTSLLLEIIPSHPVEGVTFSGAVKGFNLSGICFERCVFQQTHFVNCEFDGSSKFSQCHFVGLECTRSDTLGKSKFANITAERDAKEIIDHLKINAGKSAYTSENLEGDIKHLMSKFRSKGGSALRSVEEHHLRKGIIGASPHRDVIIEAAQRRVLEKHHISTGGKARGWNVKDTAKESVQFFAVNNVLSGELRSLFDELRDKLSL